MPDEKDLYRKLEPISRILRALGVPPPESLIPTPADVLKALGVPTPEELLADVKEDLIKLVPRVR